MLVVRSLVRFVYSIRDHIQIRMGEGKKIRKDPLSNSNSPIFYPVSEIKKKETRLGAMYF